MPRITSSRVDTYIRNHTPVVHQPFMYKFYEYLLGIPGRRAAQPAIQTIHNHTRFCIMYMNSINWDNPKISRRSLINFLSKYSRKRSIFSSLRHLFKFMLLNKDIDIDKYTSLTESKFKDGPVKIKKYAILKTDWPAAFNQLRGVRKFACWLFFSTGIRLAELAFLTVDDIHLDFKRDIYFVEIKPKPEINWAPKTIHSIREIPIRKEEAEVIQGYLDVRAKQDLNHNFILYAVRSGTTKRGKPIQSEETVGSWMRDVLIPFPEDKPKKCTIKLMKRTMIEGKYKNLTPCYIVHPDAPSHGHLRPHVCRYSYASDIYYKGKDIGLDLLDEVSALLGHESPPITYQYLQLGEKEKKERILRALDVTNY